MIRNAISIRGLGKCYRVNHAREHAAYRTLRDSLSRAATAPLRRLRGETNGTTEEFWALKDISVDIHPGEVVGIIGRNGAGKSTLLKILSRITKPTNGEVEITGRVGSLLEVGTGFHPELTGRENIYMNGSILGMSRREIARRFDEIVDFSGVDKFLDMPVKRYSSGMYVRLAFAVAAHLDPEIMIVDEVLAVGDQQFQNRCTRKMRSLSVSGRTVVFVSHNVAAVQSLCSRAIMLDRGALVQDGAVEHTLAFYSARHNSGPRGVFSLVGHAGRPPHCHAALTAASVTSLSHDDAVMMGDDVRIAVSFQTAEAITNINIGVVVKDSLGVALFTVNNRTQPSPLLASPLRHGEISCLLKALPLLPGVYYLDLYFGTNGHNTDILHDAVSFQVEPADVFGSGKLPSTEFGKFFWPAVWSVEGAL